MCVLCSVVWYTNMPFQTGNGVACDVTDFDIIVGELRSVTCWLYEFATDHELEWVWNPQIHLEPTQGGGAPTPLYEPTPQLSMTSFMHAYDPPMAHPLPLNHTTLQVLIHGDGDQAGGRCNVKLCAWRAGQRFVLAGRG